MSRLPYQWQLACGREVSIETVSIRNTYENMSGSMGLMSQYVWDNLPSALRQEFGEGVVILQPPSDGWLPVYRFVAVLHSGALPAPVQHDFSYVTVCWFRADIDGNVVDFVKQAVRDLQWESHAINCTL
jgi:hypothetical protein